MSDFHPDQLLATLGVMRRYSFVIATLLLTGCNPPADPTATVDAASFTGNWYGIRPEGVTTFHSDSSFHKNGDIVVRFFSCLSNHLESHWIDKGTWSYTGNVLTITLKSASDDDNSESYTHEYNLLTDAYDQRTLRSVTADYTFWLNRRWAEEPYDCATTKAQVDADRAQALEDGRFRSEYPDYPGDDP